MVVKRQSAAMPLMVLWVLLSLMKACNQLRRAIHTQYCTLSVKTNVRGMEVKVFDAKKNKVGYFRH